MMRRYNFNSPLAIFIILVIFFLIFQFLGILFVIIRGLFFLAVRFWYIFLGAGVLLYIIKKLKKKKNTVNRIEDNNDNKTIEINDYKIK